MKKNVEMAMKKGMALKSPFSGYLHYTNEPLSPTDPVPIPVRENILYVLALLSTRTGENMILAKEMLGNLLHFQCPQGESKGNFPTYLHLFPHCPNRYLAADLLCPLFWIFHDFSTVLGATLREKLKSALQLLLEYCLEEDQRNPARYPLRFLIASSAVAFGSILTCPEWVKRGEALFSEIGAPSPQWDPDNLALILLADLIVRQSVPERGDDSLWLHASHYWHPDLSYFCGIPVAEQQKGSEPLPRLLEAILGAYDEQLCRRLETDPVLALHAIVVRSLPIALLNEPCCVRGETGSYGSQTWYIETKKSSSRALMSKDGESSSVAAQKFAPFRLLWGSAENIHSFVCQGGLAEKIAFAVNESNSNEAMLTFSLGLPQENDEKENNREVCFYVDRHDELKITVNGTVSTTFSLGDKIELRDERMAIDLEFSLIEGQGKLMGHLMPGNRPSQCDPNIRKSHKSCDWQLFLRTVARDGPCRIAVTVRSSMK